MGFGGYLKADKGTHIIIGPVVAFDDGVTPVTTLSLGSADSAEMMKHNSDSASAVSISEFTFASITNAKGMYSMTLVTNFIDTEGRMTIFIADADLIVPMRINFEVVNANVYDSLFAPATTDYLQTDAKQICGSAATTQIGKWVANEEYDNDGNAISLRGAIKLLLATLTGKSSGGGTATLVFRDVNDAKNRISATVDADGNRTAVGTSDAS